MRFRTSTDAIYLLLATTLAGVALVLGARGCAAPPGPGSTGAPRPDAAAASASASASTSTFATTPSLSSVLGDWMALGSGCRARAAEPGNVQVDALPVSAALPLRHTARVHFDEMMLTLASLPPDAMTVVRECAVRVAVHPPSGTRIRRVSARTQVRSTKAAGVKMAILEVLKLGSLEVGRASALYEASEAHVDRPLDVALAPELPGGAPWRPLGCGAEKLVGFDITWRATRTAADEAASIEVGGARVLDLDVDLEPCVPE